MLHDVLLEFLYRLQLQSEEEELQEYESEMYVFIVDYLNSHNVEIPFGVEV